MASIRAGTRYRDQNSCVSLRTAALWPLKEASSSEGLRFGWICQRANLLHLFGKQARGKTYITCHDLLMKGTIGAVLDGVNLESKGFKGTIFLQAALST